MDHPWGDPWADADDKSPTKPEVTSPPPTIAPAPVLLNGFLDDAQWGENEDDGFGAWATSPRKPEPTEAPRETRVDRHDNVTAWEDFTEASHDAGETRNREEMLPESNEWSHIEDDAEARREPDNVVSETSDSATTIQADDAPERIAAEFTDPLQPDDDLSTRPSTSPSDVSHNEIPTESPRTSFEDERAAAKVSVEEQPTIGLDEERDEQETTADKLNESEDIDDGFGDFEDNVTHDTVEPHLLRADPEQQTLESPRRAVDDSHISRAGESELTPSTANAVTNVGSDSVNGDLLSQLFPPVKESRKVEQPPNDPVDSTSTRKAWYRLTRKQTMREFNSGTYDDTYIRVTWKTSHIRSEVNKVVARWATEDRMAGRGPGARASFYWDTAAPADTKSAFHPRKQPSISASNPIRHTGQSVPPLTTEVPAAFNWSSPSTTNPSTQGTLDTRSASSPVAAKHSAVAKLQRQEGRSVSVDLTPRPKDPIVHKRTATATNVISIPASLPSSAPIASIDSVVSTDPWASLGPLDTNPPPPTQKSIAADDDDEWGEMVESPAISTARTPLGEFSEALSRNNTVSTPSTTPKSAKSSPLQAFPPTSSRHASPIVRLKGTVSPTSALFGVNAFVPASVEEGPIGPGLLKSRNRSAESTPEKAKPQPETIAPTDEVLDKAFPVDVKPETPPALNDEDDDFSAFETALPPSEPPKSTTPPPPSTSPSPPPAFQQPPPTSPDFSIFDSPAPPSTTSANPPQPLPIDPADPWSIFETPAPTVPAEPPAPFARPPPRPVTPPTKQPLTGATNSAQRRKEEEEETVRSIIAGLPDLGYMLRR